MMTIAKARERLEGLGWNAEDKTIRTATGDTVWIVALTKDAAGSSSTRIIWADGPTRDAAWAKALRLAANPTADA